MTGWELAEDTLVPRCSRGRNRCSRSPTAIWGPGGPSRRGLPARRGPPSSTGSSSPHQVSCRFWGPSPTGPGWSSRWTASHSISGPARPPGTAGASTFGTVCWRGPCCGRGPEGGVVRFRFRRLASMEQPHSGGARGGGRGAHRPCGADDRRPGSMPPLAARAIRRGGRAGGATGLRTAAGRCDIGGRFAPSRGDDVDVGQRWRGGDRRLRGDPEHPRVRVRRSLQPGDVFTLTKFVTYHADRDPEPKPSLPAGGTSFEQVAAASAAAWEERWSTSEIEVDGDPDSQLALRFAAWSLAGSVSSTDPGSAAGARLLSGFGYRHHVFWDTDIFIIPYLTVTHPDAARNHIAYRYRGLPGARRKAEHYGRAGGLLRLGVGRHRGRGHPGVEQSDDGDRVRIWTGEIEEHIVADIAWAIDHYWIGPATRAACSTKARRSSSRAPATGPDGSSSRTKGLTSAESSVRTSTTPKWTTTCSPTPWRRGSCERPPDWSTSSRPDHPGRARQLLERSRDRRRGRRVVASAWLDGSLCIAPSSRCLGAAPRLLRIGTVSISGGSGRATRRCTTSSARKGSNGRKW